MGVMHYVVAYSWARGGFVFKAHRLLYHSTLGLRVIKKKYSWAGRDSGRDSGRDWVHHVARADWDVLPATNLFVDFLLIYTYIYICVCVCVCVCVYLYSKP